MVGYMGISQSNLKDLLNHTGKQHIIWECSSYDELCYVYEHQEDNDYIGDCIFNALVQCIATRDNKIYVLELNIPDDIVSDDYSCENMENAKCFDSIHFNKDMIQSIQEVNVDTCILYYMCKYMEYNRYYIYDLSDYTEMEQTFINHLNIDDLLLCEIIEITHGNLINTNLDF